ncbi:MAG: 3'-5' exonuclease, partial [bacterium]
HETATEDAEAEYVVHRVEKLVGGTSMFSQDSGRVASEAESEVSFGDIAVLYRLNSQRAALEEAFERSGIPYQVSGDKPLIAQPGVAHILTTLQLTDNMPVLPERAASLLQFIVAGIGAQTSAAIQSFFQQTGEQIALEKLQDLRRQKDILSEQAKVGLLCFSQEILDLRARLQEAGLVATLKHLVLLDGWQVVLSANEKLADALQRLVRIARLCSGLREFTDALYLQRAADALDSRAERVSLMTMHAAKGLEFPVVFVVGCEKNLIPLQLEGYTSDPAEERRLFYVGMTRAKEQLYLLRAKQRTLFGKTRETVASPFLDDIEEALKSYDLASGHKPKRSKKKPVNQMDLFG